MAMQQRTRVVAKPGSAPHGDYFETNLVTFPGFMKSLETNVSIRFQRQKRVSRESLLCAKLITGGFSLELCAASG